MFDFVKSVEVFEKFFKKDLWKFKANGIEWKIYQFFNDRQRAEILKSLPFSARFVRDFIKKIKEFRDRNNIMDNGAINSVHTFQDMIHYIQNVMKVNYIKYFEMIMGNFALI